MSHYGHGNHSEKVTQFGAYSFAALGAVEMYFNLAKHKSFLVANIPMLHFDVSNAAYGIVLAGSTATALAIARGWGIKTIAMVGLMACIAFSGVTSCTNKSVRLTDLPPSHAGKAIEPQETEKVDERQASLGFAGKEWGVTDQKAMTDKAKAAGYKVVAQYLNDTQVAWCDLDDDKDGIPNRQETDLSALNCTTGHIWKARKGR